MQQTRPRLALGIAVEHASDSVLVHNPRTAKVHVLNRSAGFVLERCDGSRTLDAIAAELKMLAEPSADVRADVCRIVEELRALGLLERDTAAQP